MCYYYFKGPFDILLLGGIYLQAFLLVFLAVLKTFDITIAAVPRYLDILICFAIIRRSLKLLFGWQKSLNSWISSIYKYSKTLEHLRIHLGRQHLRIKRYPETRRLLIQANKLIRWEEYKGTVSCSRRLSKFWILVGTFCCACR